MPKLVVFQEACWVLYLFLNAKCSDSNINNPSKYWENWNKFWAEEFAASSKNYVFDLFKIHTCIVSK